MTDKDNLTKMLYSKKFWAALVGLFVDLVGDRAGVDADALTKAVWVIVSYVLGQGLADFGKEK